MAQHSYLAQTLSSEARRHLLGEPAIDTQHKDLRTYPRILAPKGLIVVWRSSDQRGASRLGTVGLGGLFLKTPNPPAAGSSVELVIPVSSGSPVRTRAAVYNVKPGEGMGVKFVQMRAEDRLRLNQFLHTHSNK
jgi:hypothetical protein